MYVTVFTLFLISFVIKVYCPGRGGEQCGKKTLSQWRGEGGAMR
jgi:hypothetical protein